MLYWVQLAMSGIQTHNQLPYDHDHDGPLRVETPMYNIILLITVTMYLKYK
jgi:hypothetical protein